MTWIFPALAAGALLLLMGSKKKATAQTLTKRPQKGEVWTWVLRTSRPFTDADWDMYMRIMKEQADIMGVTKAGPDRYVLTLRYLQTGHRVVIGKRLYIGDDWMMVESATRAPIG